MMPALKISSDQDGKRLDVILARAYPSYSRAFLQKWIREGRVTHSEKELIIPNYRVHAGETLEIAEFKQPPSPGLRPPSPFLGEGWGEGSPSPAILFEDDSILVLNKPAGLVVHPAPSHTGATLVDWLETYLGPKVTGLFGDSSRLGVVHRLDKDTTGVLLVAKTVVAQHLISKQFQARRVQKTYAAFIEGIPKAKMGIIAAPVGRSHRAPSRMAVSASGRPSETAFEVIKTFPASKALAGPPGCRGAMEVSLVSLHPKTGRTHQIRVHCAAIGHPVVGDLAYGSQSKWAKEYGIRRPLLHAERLELQHPVTRKKVAFHAPWPEDMNRALALFLRSTKAIAAAALLTIVATTARAEPRSSAGNAPARAKTGSSHSSGTSQALKKEMSSLQSQFKSLIEEVSALGDRVTALQSSLDEIGASGRLRDLEKSISDLNAKAAGASNVTEETKSQSMDLSRKLKAQQEMLDVLRDEVDRLKAELVEAKAHEAAVPSVGGGTK